MSVAAERAFLKSIREKKFAPVYFLHGDDDYLKEDALRQLIAAAVDPATRDFNLEIRRGGELDGATLASLLGTPPMMAERRLVAVRDVGALKKDARAALEKYLSNPAADVILALVPVGSGAKKDSLLESKTHAVKFDPLSDERVPKWIEHQVKALGATITPGALSMLHECVGNDLPALNSELDKLVSFAVGQEIDEASVTAIVGTRADETLGDLLDAVLDRDARRALRLLPQILQQPKNGAVPFVMTLGTQMMAVAWARAALDRGTPRSQLYQELFGLLKESGGAFTGRSWGDAVSAWTRGVERWTAPQLDRALDLLLTADAALKDSRVSSDEQLLATLLLSLCHTSERMAAA